MSRIVLPVSLFALSLAACSGSPDPAPTPSATASTSAPAPVRPSPSPSATVQPASNALPVAMYGRFGMGPADCTTRMGDDKGLIRVSAEGLRFYESVARLTKATENTPTLVRGRFAYSGEGMEWNREARLELKDDGQTLVLEEFGDDAVPGPRTFRRCAS